MSYKPKVMLYLFLSVTTPFIAAQPRGCGGQDKEYTIMNLDLLNMQPLSAGRPSRGVKAGGALTYLLSLSLTHTCTRPALTHTHSGHYIRDHAQRKDHTQALTQKQGRLEKQITTYLRTHPPFPDTHSCVRLRGHAHRRNRGQAKGGGRKDNDQAKQRRQERAAAAEGGDRCRHEEAAGCHSQDPGAADQALIC